VTCASVLSRYTRLYPLLVCTLSASVAPDASLMNPRGRSRIAATSRGLNGSVASSSPATSVQYPTPIEVMRKAMAMASVSPRMFEPIERVTACPGRARSRRSRV
jgi:hypothetical protein